MGPAGHVDRTSRCLDHARRAQSVRHRPAVHQLELERLRSGLRADAWPQLLRAPDLHVSMSSPAQDSRRFAEIGGFGFAVVAVVALVTTFSELVPMVFGRP